MTLWNLLSVLALIGGRPWRSAAISTSARSWSRANLSGSSRIEIQSGLPASAKEGHHRRSQPFSYEASQCAKRAYLYKRVLRVLGSHLGLNPQRVHFWRVFGPSCVSCGVGEVLGGLRVGQGRGRTPGIRQTSLFASKYLTRYAHSHCSICMLVSDLRTCIAALVLPSLRNSCWAGPWRASVK